MGLPASVTLPVYPLACLGQTPPPDIPFWGQTWAHNPPALPACQVPGHFPLYPGLSIHIKWVSNTTVPLLCILGVRTPLAPRGDWQLMGLLVG